MPSGPDARRLRIVYRAYAGENSKPRPPYYSKLLALVSLLRAAEAIGPTADLVFLNDGLPPPQLLAVMEGAGQVIAVDGGSNRRSYRAMLALESVVEGPADEIVWFSEDDYLYAPDALHRLASGAAALPAADYFTMYGSRALDASRSGLRPWVRPESGAEGDPEAKAVDGVNWYRAVSTTSTYGVRRGALCEDLRLLRACPFTGGAWDNTTCLMVQGYQPFGMNELRQDLLPNRVPLSADGLRAVARGSVRLAAGAFAFRRPSRRRVLVGSDPELISHMESLGTETHPSSRRTFGIDWMAVAGETMAWGRDRGIRFPSAVAPGGRVPPG